MPCFPPHYWTSLFFSALLCIQGLCMWTHHWFLFPLVSRWHLANGQSQQDIRQKGETDSGLFFSSCSFQYVHCSLQLNNKASSKKSPCNFVLSCSNQYSFFLSPEGVGFFAVLIQRGHCHLYDISLPSVSLITLCQLLCLANTPHTLTNTSWQSQKRRLNVKFHMSSILTVSMICWLCASKQCDIEMKQVVVFYNIPQNERHTCRSIPWIFLHLSSNGHNIGYGPLTHLLRNS